jgi:isochorismate pyruvate lyase
MSDPQADPTSLAEVRRRIDALDRELVALLAARAALVRHAVRFKTTAAAARAPDRVEQVIASVRDLATAEGADPDLAEQVYRTMIAWFVAAELRALDDPAT